jgi:hypothetical protein
LIFVFTFLLFIPDVTIPIDILFRVDATSGPTLTVIIPADAPIPAAPITTKLSAKLPKTPRGIIETIAGTGSPGYIGDGGQATSAKLNFPGGVSVDAIGRLFLADLDN